MARAKEVETQGNLDQLSAEVATLKADVAALIKTLESAAEKESGTVIEMASKNADLLQQKINEVEATAKEAATDAMGAAQRFVQEKPMMALLAAAGAGALFGLLTSRK